MYVYMFLEVVHDATVAYVVRVHHTLCNAVLLCELHCVVMITARCVI